VKCGFDNFKGLNLFRQKMVKIGNGNFDSKYSKLPSPLGDKVHPWGTTSPLGPKFAPRGEVKNGPKERNQCLLLRETNGAISAAKIQFF
jgi:hypothetical protein